jgi:hypothetical protein
MINNDLIDYLKEKTKGKLIMNPEQLANEIGISSKQQSKLRKDKTFPIPYKNIGRLVYYSIYDVANFLLNGETNNEIESKEKIKENSIEIPIKRKRKTEDVQDLSHIFLLRAFATNLEQRANSMLELSESLINYANKKELKDKFENKFKPKGIKFPIIKE